MQKGLMVSIWTLLIIGCADKSKNTECDTNPFNVSVDNNGFKFYYAKRDAPKGVRPVIHNNNIEYGAPLCDKGFEDSAGFIGFIIA